MKTKFRLVNTDVTKSQCRKTRSSFRKFRDLERGGGAVDVSRWWNFPLHKYT